MSHRSPHVGEQDGGAWGCARTCMCMTMCLHAHTHHLPRQKRRRLAEYQLASILPLTSPGETLQPSLLVDTQGGVHFW